MRRYTRAISSFKKSLTAITFDGSLVAFILALYSIFGVLLIKTFELQSSKCKTLIKETCHKFNSKIARCNLTKKNANDFQKVIYRSHVRWIIGGLYCGLVQDLFLLLNWDFKTWLFLGVSEFRIGCRHLAIREKDILPQSRSMDVPRLSHWWPLFWPCTGWKAVVYPTM